MREKPEQEGKGGTEYNASDDGKIESRVFAKVDDVAGEFSKTVREFTAEIEESTDDDEEAAEEQQGAAEFAERLHEDIIDD